MTKVMRLHENYKKSLLEEAERFEFPQIIEILQRGEANALLLNGADEAVLIVDLLIFMRQRLELRYPYYDEDESHFNPMHDDLIDNFVGGLWQKVLSTLKADFGVLWPSERNTA